MTKEGEEAGSRWLTGLTEIMALTEEMGRAIAVSDFTQLLKLLDKRGQLMANLGEITDFNSSPTQFQEEPWGEIAGLLEEIARRDQANREAISGRLKSLQENSRELEEWRRAARAYSGGTLPDPGRKT